MEYKINPAVYTNMFALPVSIVDEHIRMAGTMQLRVLLWLFRHAAELPASSSSVGKALGIDEDEVIDAFEYWKEKGIVLFSDESPVFVKPAEKEHEVSESLPHTETQTELTAPKKIVEAITVNPPTHEECTRRLMESQHLRELCNMAQQQLGATLSHNMQSNIIMLHDDYGLPVEVIALVIEYAVSKGKPTSKYIANVGKLWCEQEIDTIDKAMDFIENQSSVETHWREFCDATGVKNPSPTKKQREFLGSWINTMKFSMDMIVLAYEEMANNTDKFSFPYMNKILVNWEKENIRTPEDVSMAKKKRSDSFNSSKKGDKDAPKPSFDLDLAEKKAFMNPLDYFKKKDSET